MSFVFQCLRINGNFRIFLSKHFNLAIQMKMEVVRTVMNDQLAHHADGRILIAAQPAGTRAENKINPHAR